MNKEELISAAEIAKLLLSFDQGREYFHDGKMPGKEEKELSNYIKIYLNIEWK